MIASLSKFDSRRLSLPSETESKKRSMIKELRVDYRKCFTNSALSSTAKRFSPTTLQAYRTGLFEEEFDSISPLTPIRQIRGPLNPAGQATRKGLAMRGLYRTEEM